MWKEHRVPRLPAMAVVMLVSQTVAFAQYLKIDPPPDSNKPEPASDVSCWLHTAANMLAGAGYSGPSGGDVQTRADEIFGQLSGSAVLQSQG